MNVELEPGFQRDAQKRDNGTLYRASWADSEMGQVVRTPFRKSQVAMKDPLPGPPPPLAELSGSTHKLDTKRTLPCAHVLLNSLNETRKRDKMRGLPNSLSFFFATSLINSIIQGHGC